MNTLEEKICVWKAVQQIKQHKAENQCGECKGYERECPAYCELSHYNPSLKKTEFSAKFLLRNDWEFSFSNLEALSFWKPIWEAEEIE